MKKILAIAIASGLLMSSAVTIAAEETVTPAPEAVTQPALTVINPANPAFILSFMNPAGHEATHQAMNNPANWMQFTQPQFFMQMANPANASAWMNPAVYTSMMNPATMMHWMQPATIMNEMSSVPVATMMNPASYMGFMNPAIAMSWMNPASFTGGCGTGSDSCSTTSAPNMFDMGAWTNMFQPVLPAAEETKEQG